MRLPKSIRRHVLRAHVAAKRLQKSRPAKIAVTYAKGLILALLIVKSIKSAKEETVDATEKVADWISVFFATAVLVGVGIEWRIIPKLEDIARELVTVGIAGEIIFERRARACSSELSLRAKRELAAATKEAGEAKERAAKAELELERLKLPRFISEEQHKRLVEGLKRVPSGEIYLRPGTLDAEAIEFSKMFRAAFTEAGREPSPFPGTTPVSWSWPGLWLQMRDRSNPPKHAMALWNCLKMAGFDVPWWGNEEGHPEDGVTLGIGSKV